MDLVVRLYLLKTRQKLHSHLEPDLETPETNTKRHRTDGVNTLRRWDVVSSLTLSLPLAVLK